MPLRCSKFEDNASKQHHKIKSMPTISSHRRSVLAQCFGWRRSFLAAALLTPATLSTGAVQAQDCIYEMRETAKTWAMHRIAVIQAAAGDVLGAKRTVSQIGEVGDRGPSDVTGVWFCNGRAIYDHPPTSSGWKGCNWQCFFDPDQTAGSVPSQAAPAPPSNYLNPDPHHGAVVRFTEEYDSHGTRVTSRKHADGYMVIETPHPDRYDR